MVGRLQMNGKAAVIDLDGTWCRRNTFTLFVARMMRQALRHPAELLRITGIVSLRKMRLMSHAEAKRRLVKIASRMMTAGDLDAFASRITEFANPGVEAFADAFRRRGGTLILATAAPEIYVQPLARMAGFDYVMASSAKTTAEMRGERKLRAVVSLLDHTGLSLEAVLTDHYDDLPLLIACKGRRILVSPSQMTRMQCSLAGLANIEYI